MTWVRLEGRFFHHPKIAGQSAGARLLYIAALCYCGENETNGFVPLAMLPSLALDACVRQWKPVAVALCEGGLWETCEGGFRVHDYLDYNPSRERLRAERQKTAERVNGWRARHRGNAITGGEENGKVTALHGNTSETSNGVTESLVTLLVTSPTCTCTGTCTEHHDQATPDHPIGEGVRGGQPPKAKRKAKAKPSPPPVSDTWLECIQTMVPKPSHDGLIRMGNLEKAESPPGLVNVQEALQEAIWRGKRDPVTYAAGILRSDPEFRDERHTWRRTGTDSGGAGHRGEIRPRSGALAGPGAGDEIQRQLDAIRRGEL